MQAKDLQHNGINQRIHTGKKKHGFEKSHNCVSTVKRDLRNEKRALSDAEKRPVPSLRQNKTTYRKYIVIL